MKTLLKILIIALAFINIANANQIDFYWTKNSSWDLVKNSNILELNKKLENFYKKTWLNTDIVVLWKGDSCYLKNNFDSCIQKRENYSSDLIIVLSMKSDIKSRWDIRSLIKDQFKESITPRDLKNLQDNIIGYFKNQNFKWWLIAFLTNLENKISEKCNQVWINNSCNAVKLSREYHNYISKKEYEAKYNMMMKFIYFILIILSIIVSYKLIKYFYIKKINNLYKDIKYKNLTLNDYNLFNKDRKDILNKFYFLKKGLEIKLWDLDKNIFNLISLYLDYSKNFNKINKKLLKMEKVFLNREKTKKRIWSKI